MTIQSDEELAEKFALESAAGKKNAVGPPPGIGDLEFCSAWIEDGKAREAPKLARPEPNPKSRIPRSETNPNSEPEVRKTRPPLGVDGALSGIEAIVDSIPSGRSDRRTSNVERRSSNVERGTSNVERRTWNVDRRTSIVERRTWNVDRRTWNAERGTWNAERERQSQLAS
jgi:hypothetical protein